MLATTGTMRVVLRRYAVNQSPQETPERALVPKPPLVARTARCMQCAGVRCGRPAVFGEGWGGEGRVRLVGGHARDGLARPEACSPRCAPRTPIGRARYPRARLRPEGVHPLPSG